MSTIHDALKKAQKEKDDIGPGGSSMLSSHAAERDRLFRRIAAFGLVPVVLILLAFASYSWLDSANFRAPGERVSRAVGEGENLEECYRSAKSFQSEGDLEHARTLYQKVLRIDPGHVDTLNNLGVIYLQSRDFLAARNFFEKAIHLRPGCVEPHYNLACLYAHSGESEKSLHYLRKAVSLEPAAGEWAMQDEDFQNLRGTEEFRKVVSYH
jgi:tetratricopeptide (TPR) repeat protein